MKIIRENISLILSALSVVAFLIAATTYVPPIPFYFSVIISISNYAAPVVALAAVIFGLVDIFKFKRKKIQNSISILMAIAPWIFILSLHL